MKPHPKLRKTIKWGGAVVTVLLVVVWIGSGWFTHTSCFRTGQIIMVGSGGFCCGEMDDLSRIDSAQLAAAEQMMSGWHAFSFEWMPSEVRAGGVRLFSYPFWIPLIASALATATAWRLDTLARRRRAKLNLCPKCNYDRTGLAVGAVCPECGVATTSS